MSELRARVNNTNYGSDLVGLWVVSEVNSVNTDTINKFIPVAMLSVIDCLDKRVALVPRCENSNECRIRFAAFFCEVV